VKDARRQVISPPPLDDSPAQGPYLVDQARGRLSLSRLIRD